MGLSSSDADLMMALYASSAPADAGGHVAKRPRVDYTLQPSMAAAAATLQMPMAPSVAAAVTLPGVAGILSQQYIEQQLNRKVRKGSIQRGEGHDRSV